jgi:hypothetical protein
MYYGSEKYRGVTPVREVVVRLEEAPWLFATQNSEKISDFWQEKQRSHPHFYDGQVHVMTSWEIRNLQTGAAAFIGNLRRTNFASFLYWKNCEANTQNTIDFSGGAALLCSDGALLMAVTGERTIMPGTLEFPSGFVDVSDFDDNELNFNRHVEREVIEEFSITKEQLGRPKQYLVSAADSVVQVISIFAIDTKGREFTRWWRGRRSEHLQSEISSVVAIYRSGDLGNFAIQAHVRSAVSYLLSVRCPSR